jgi:hypothetical protein
MYYPVPFPKRYLFKFVHPTKDYSRYFRDCQEYENVLLKISCEVASYLTLLSFTGVCRKFVFVLPTLRAYHALFVLSMLLAGFALRQLASIADSENFDS